MSKVHQEGELKNNENYEVDIANAEIDEGHNDHHELDIWDDLKEYAQDYKFFSFLILYLVVMIFTYHIYNWAMWVGFVGAAYSAIANDSIQTLGTLLACTRDTKWYYLYIYLGGILTFTIIYSWVAYDGDVSWQRLSSKGYDSTPTEYTYVQTIAPAVLMILTRVRAPVSTSFLLLGIFATENSAFLSVVWKSAQGFLVSFVYSIFFYGCIYRFFENPLQKVDQKGLFFLLQFFATGFLWSMWLMQDMSNIAVYLNRKLDVPSLVAMIVSLNIFLMILCYIRGDKLQRIVESKTRVKNVAEATLVNFQFGVILLIFKNYSTIPMSTTWVFLGLMGGRELGISFEKLAGPQKDIWNAIKMNLHDIMMGLLGIGVSVGIMFLGRL